MGLDMYLSVRKYIGAYDWSANYGEGKPPLTPTYKKLVRDFGLKKYENAFGFKSGHVEAVAITWRKANAIHQWFVDNCADGEDDCKPVYVPRGQLEELLNTIQTVLLDRDKADELLPTQNGFFFGSTEYGEWYWEDLERTRKELSKLLETSKDDKEASFIYEASW